MYSVKFNIKNNKKYYSQSNKKYHLKNEDIMLNEIPSPADADKMPYYYYEGGEWIFDNDAYERASEQVADIPVVQETVTMEEILNGLMEIAESISDIEDAIVELAGMEA